MIELLGQLWDSVLGIRLDGESLTSDPQQLIPRLNDLIEANSCDRCVIEMYNIDSAAYYPFWEELLPQAARTTRVRRCVIVSEEWAEEWARKLITPLFADAKVEWFDDSNLSNAWKWATRSEVESEYESECESEPVDSSTEELELIGLA